MNQQLWKDNGTLCEQSSLTGQRGAPGRVPQSAYLVNPFVEHKAAPWRFEELTEVKVHKHVEGGVVSLRTLSGCRASSVVY